jgi:hypothetical protein
MPATKPPTGLRRLERWLVGIAMAIVAHIFEKVALRTLKQEGGSVEPPAPTELTAKGGEVDFDPS